jgi:N-carbamoyl-L-amino-acid hydrolase
MAISKKSLNFGQSLQSEVDKFWTPEDGRYCIGWSHEETNLMHRISEIAHDVLKMDVYEDLAGNRYLVKEYFSHKFDKVRMAGSHVDSVKNGGRYDGPAGIIAPLVALYQMQQENIRPHQSVVVPIWRNEESPWVNQFAVGSKLATGQLSAEFLRTAKHTEFSHNTLSWQMQNVLGLDTRSLLRRMESDNPALFDVSKVECAIETHIEQGSQLEKADKSIGIVTSIRGNLRFPDKIEFSGVAGHSGTVPQNERKDALRAMGLMIANIDKTLSQIKDSGRDIVWSFPQGGDDMGHPTTICEKAWLRPEIRSTDINVLDRCKSHFEDAARQVSANTELLFGLNVCRFRHPFQCQNTLTLSFSNSQNQAISRQCL